MLFGLNKDELQTYFTIIEQKASEVGLELNQAKCHLLLTKIDCKQTRGESVRSTNRKVEAWEINFRDGKRVPVTNQETYLGELGDAAL